MSIEGINFPAGMDLPVGIFSKQGSQYIPLKGKVVRTDNHGAFETRIDLDGLDPGTYFIIPILNPEQAASYKPTFFVLFTVANPEGG